jgi:hypothetical protein
MYRLCLLLIAFCLSACEQEQQGTGAVSNNLAKDQSVEDQMQSTMADIDQMVKPSDQMVNPSDQMVNPSDPTALMNRIAGNYVVKMDLLVNAQNERVMLPFYLQIFPEDPAYQREAKILFQPIDCTSMSPFMLLTNQAHPNPDVTTGLVNMQTPQGQWALAITKMVYPQDTMCDLTQYGNTYTPISIKDLRLNFSDLIDNNQLCGLVTGSLFQSLNMEIPLNHGGYKSTFFATKIDQDLVNVDSLMPMLSACP